MFPLVKLFDLILFDLEGTLVDFQWRLEAAVQEMLPVLAASGIDIRQYSASPDYAALSLRMITDPMILCFVLSENRAADADIPGLPVLYVKPNK
ncbi:MAG: hypothetical protein A2277_19475 [Desulfobacterales bacterium RIFOXYA12_FULL_46_15]|nr:MAG: hypothetical protein A2277_19475 [Desulfobacterales bacterium RIFOXYA12_FULL_46_15]